MKVIVLKRLPVPPKHIEQCSEQCSEQEAKYDNGKIKPCLVPTQIIRDIAVVREYGIKKYKDPDNWKKVEIDRYVNALYRHFLAFIDDPKSVDNESGIPHYKHIACNMAFICELLKDDTSEKRS